MRLVALAVVLLCGISSRVLGQSWVAAGIPCYTVEMVNVHVDTLADALYYCGASSANNDNDFSDQVVSVYKGGGWDTLGLFRGRPNAIVRWQDTLVVGGSFFDVNGDTNARYIAYYDSVGWHPYGDMSSSVFDLKVIDGELYAIGSFEVADGDSCYGIAKRQGGAWVSVGTMDVYTNNIVLDLLEWNDTLYATGVIRFSNGLPRDLAWFDSTEWHPLGPGITGGASTGRSLCVYQDQLYVGGSIDVQAGNAGHGIMRWDGTQFQPVGAGLQGSCGTYGCPAGAIDMHEHNGLLFVSGTFRYAGFQPTEHMATWDGVQWCGMPGELRGPVQAFAFYHDTLFAAPFLDAEGVNVNSGAKFIDTTYFSTCSGPMVVVAPSGPAQLSVVQQGLNLWAITGLDAGQHNLTVLDLSGRVVLAQRVQASEGQASELALPPVSSGVYVLRSGGRAVRFFAP